MKIDFIKNNNVLSIKIDGEIDHHFAAEIREKADDYIIRSNVKYIVMDFTRVGFMDSSGIGMLMGRYKNIKRIGGELYIVGINKSVKRILDMAGITSLIPIYKDQTELLEVIK